MAFDPLSVTGFRSFLVLVIAFQAAIRGLQLGEQQNQPYNLFGAGLTVAQVAQVNSRNVRRHPRERKWNSSRRPYRGAA